MSDRENGQLPLAKPTVRNRISPDIWEQIKTGYAAGINLREIARKMDIPEGTVSLTLSATATREGSQGLPRRTDFRLNATWKVYNLAAVLDLNGDGKLELIVHSFYYEGGETTIYRCEADKIEAVLSVECGA